MTPDSLFQVSCIIAAVGWIVIIFVSPFWAWWDKFVMGVVITLLALIYSYLNLTNFHPSDVKGFGSLDGILGLYQNKYILLAGWVHIMAFDLIGAIWLKKNAIRHGLSHWTILIPIIFTCLLGPLGFLLYLIIRAFKTRSIFTDN